MADERRHSSRVPFAIKVAYWVNDQKREEAYIVEAVNISEGGIFLKTDLPLGIGTDVHLELSIPGSPEPLRLRGQVVWSGEEIAGEGKRVIGKGIQFNQCDDLSREKLTEFIERTA
jgi:uncharacterized protein (TIGR02266 family)